VTLVRRITGFHARGLARTMTAVLVLASVVSFFLPLNGTVTDLRTAEAWLGAVYVAVVAAFAYGVVAAMRMWQRDRIGAALAGGAATLGVIASVVAADADVGGRSVPYLLDAPIAVWVVLMAMVVSREYADRGERLAAGERRFRAVFDEASEFVFLTQPDGTLTQANRAALTAAGVVAEDVVARPIWDTPWWSQDGLRL